MNAITFVTLTIAASALPFAARAAWYLLSLRGRIDALAEKIERVDRELRSHWRFYGPEMHGTLYYLEQRIPDPRHGGAELARVRSLAEEIPERDRYLEARKEALEAKLLRLVRRLPD